ncbi:hypothetical protein BDK51DRAFT_29496, partial [Blyttiomyces helicus]
SGAKTSKELREARKEQPDLQRAERVCGGLRVRGGLVLCERASSVGLGVKKVVEGVDLAVAKVGSEGYSSAGLRSFFNVLLPAPEGGGGGGCPHKQTAAKFYTRQQYTSNTQRKAAGETGDWTEGGGAAAASTKTIPPALVEQLLTEDNKRFLVDQARETRAAIDLAASEPPLSDSSNSASPYSSGPAPAAACPLYKLFYRGNDSATRALRACRQEKGGEGLLLLSSRVQWSRDGTCVGRHLNHVRITGNVAVAGLVEKSLSGHDAEFGIGHVTGGWLVRILCAKQLDAYVEEDFARRYFGLKATYCPALIESRFCEGFFDALVGSPDVSSEVVESPGSEGSESEDEEVAVGISEEELLAGAPRSPLAQPNLPPPKKNATIKRKVFQTRAVIVGGESAGLKAATDMARSTSSKDAAPSPSLDAESVVSEVTPLANSAPESNEIERSSLNVEDSAEEGDLDSSFPSLASMSRATKSSPPRNIPSKRPAPPPAWLEPPAKITRHPSRSSPSFADSTTAAADSTSVLRPRFVSLLRKNSNQERKVFKNVVRGGRADSETASATAPTTCEDAVRSSSLDAGLVISAATVADSTDEGNPDCSSSPSGLSRAPKPNPPPNVPSKRPAKEPAQLEPPSKIGRYPPNPARSSSSTAASATAVDLTVDSFDKQPRDLGQAGRREFFDTDAFQFRVEVLAPNPARDEEKVQYASMNKIGPMPVKAPSKKASKESASLRSKKSASLPLAQTVPIETLNRNGQGVAAETGNWMFVLEPGRIGIVHSAKGSADLSSFPVEEIEEIQYSLKNGRCVIALLTTTRDKYIATLDNKSGGVFLPILPTIRLRKKARKLQGTQAGALWKETIDATVPKETAAVDPAAASPHETTPVDPAAASSHETAPVDPSTANPHAITPVDTAAASTAPVDPAAARAMPSATVSSSLPVSPSRRRSGFLKNLTGAWYPQPGPASLVLPAVEDSKKRAHDSESVWVTQIPRTGMGDVGRKAAHLDAGIGRKNFAPADSDSARDLPKRSGPAPNESSGPNNSERYRLEPKVFENLRLAPSASTPVPPTRPAQNRTAITVYDETSAPNLKLPYKPRGGARDPRPSSRQFRSNEELARTEGVPPTELPSQISEGRRSVLIEHTTHPARSGQSAPQPAPPSQANPPTSPIQNLGEPLIATDDTLPTLNAALRAALAKNAAGYRPDAKMAKKEITAAKQRRDQISIEIAKLKEGGVVKKDQEKLKQEKENVESRIEYWKIAKEVAETRQKIPTLAIFPKERLSVVKCLGGDVWEVTVTDPPADTPRILAHKPYRRVEGRTGQASHKRSRLEVEARLGLLKEVAILWALRGRGLDVPEVKGLVEDGMGISGFLMPRYTATLTDFSPWKGPLELKTAGAKYFSLILQLLLTVATLHDLGISHMDLHHENVMVLVTRPNGREEWTLRVCDLGAAHVGREGAVCAEVREALPNWKGLGEAGGVGEMEKLDGNFGRRDYRPPELRHRAELPLYPTKIDSWNIGILLLSLLSPIFPPPIDYQSELHDRIDEDVPDPWRDICRGFLVERPDERDHSWCKHRTDPRLDVARVVEHIECKGGYDWVEGRDAVVAVFEKRGRRKIQPPSMVGRSLFPCRYAAWIIKEVDPTHPCAQKEGKHRRYALPWQVERPSKPWTKKLRKHRDGRPETPPARVEFACRKRHHCRFELERCEKTYKFLAVAKLFGPSNRSKFEDHAVIAPHIARAISALNSLDLASSTSFDSSWQGLSFIT